MVTNRNLVGTLRITIDVPVNAMEMKYWLGRDGRISGMDRGPWDKPVRTICLETVGYRVSLTPDKMQFIADDHVPDFVSSDVAHGLQQIAAKIGKDVGEEIVKQRRDGKMMKKIRRSELPA